MPSRKPAFASILAVVAVAAFICPALGEPCRCASVTRIGGMNVHIHDQIPFAEFLHATQEVSTSCGSGSPSECGFCFNFYTERLDDLTGQWVDMEYNGAQPGAPYYLCGSTGNTKKL